MRVIVQTFTAAIIAPAPSAQTVAQLIADDTLLNAELERRKKLGMASVDDMRCILAAATYSPSVPVNVSPSHPSINPQPTKLKTPSKSDPPPHG